MKKTCKIFSMVLVLTVVFSLLCTVTVGAEAASSIVADVTLVDGTAGMDKLVESGVLRARVGTGNTAFTPVYSDGYAQLVDKNRLQTYQGSNAYWGTNASTGIIRPTYTYEISGEAKTTYDSVTLALYASEEVDVDGDGVNDRSDSDHNVAKHELATVTKDSPVSFSEQIHIYCFWRSGTKQSAASVSTPMNLAIRAMDGDDDVTWDVWVKNLTIKQLDTTLYGPLEISAATNNVVTDMEIGATAQLVTKAKGTASGRRYPVTRGNRVVYETSDARVATINENGVVTAMGGGTATITAKLYDKNDSSKYLASNEFTVTVAGSAAPTISATAITPGYDVKYTVDGVEKTAPYSIIAYGKFTGDVTKYGFTLTSTANGITNADLKGEDNKDGVFAIRLVANDIEASDTFRFVPYIVSAGETIPGTEVTAVLTKK